MIIKQPKMKKILLLEVKVLPISDKYLDYANAVSDKLKKLGLRSEVDGRHEKIGRKIIDAQLMKVPYILIVGEKEMNENKVSVREQGEDVGLKDVDDLSIVKSKMREINIEELLKK